VLAEDLAAQLGTIGHLSALRRPGSGRRLVQNTMDLGALESMNPEQRQGPCCRWDAALTAWRDWIFRQAASARFARDSRSRFPSKRPGTLPGTVRIYADGLGFLGLGRSMPRPLVPLD